MSRKQNNNGSQRYVRTMEGEARFGLPINSPIGKKPSRPATSSESIIRRPESLGEPNEASRTYDARRHAIADGNTAEVERLEAEILALPDRERDRGERISVIGDQLLRRTKSPEAAQAAIERSHAALAHAIEGRQLAINVSSYDLPDIIASGRILSQRDRTILTSTGDYAPDYRENLELTWFGEHTEPPIYGYLRDPRGAQSGADDFGDIALIMDDDMRDLRTTVTVGDSLGLEKRAFPGPLHDPGTYSADPLLASRFDSADSYAAYLNQGTDAIDDEGFYREHYLEAQIHGGVHVSDIKEFVFTYEPNEQMKTLLSENRLPWSVRDDDFTGENARIWAEGGDDDD